MLKVLELFALDWKRIFKSKAASLLMLALLVIPSLYCWFNVWALWDPYTNTSDLKVAVYSADKTAHFQGKDVAIGKQLVGQLKKNDKLGWTFVDSEAEVKRGVQSGKYYAGIYVPENFSSQLLSFVDGKVRKPKLEYYVNEKINAIAPKLTATGASTLQATIGSKFQSTVATTLMGTFNKAGVDLDNNLPMLRRFASLVLDSNEQLPELDSYVEAAQDLQTKMPAIKTKVAQVNSFMGYLPEVNRLAQKVVGANSYLPAVEDAGQMASVVQEKLPEIQTAGQQIKMVDSDWGQLEQTLNKAIKTSKNGLIVLQQVDKTLPAITAAGKNAQDSVGVAQDEIIPAVEKTLPQVQKTVGVGLTMLTNLNDGLAANTTRANQYLSQLQADPDSQAARAGLNNLLAQNQTNLTNGAQTANGLANALQALQRAYDGLNPKTGQPAFTADITRLQNIAKALTGAATHARNAQSLLDKADLTDVQKQLGAIGDAATQFADLNRQLQNSQLPTRVTRFNTTFKQLLNSTSTTLKQLNTKVIPQLPALLGNTESVVQTAIGFMTKYQQQLPAVHQELHDANVMLNGNMGKITSGVNTAVDLYQNDYPTLKGKLQTATGLIQNDLPGLESQLTSDVALMNAKLPVAEKALTQANDLIESDWPLIRTGIQKGAKAIKQGERSVDFDKLIVLLKRDAGKEADFLAKPVELKTKSFYAIPTYGSASAPFYTALCMWVGGLLLSSILSTDFILSDKQHKRYGTKTRFSGRFLTFAVIGLLQALIVALGNMFLIHTYVASPVAFVVASLFLDLMFMGILYALVALFGNVGKGLGIIILVLSISGAGGNFPIQLSGKFFQMINPWLPFTYGVNLLRETVGGIYWPNMWVDIAVLAAYGVLFFLLGLFLKKPLEPFMTRVHENAKKSMIVH
ncbi:YhgE/Pip domain-containing protein [Lacticaseibacillus pabuli]|uniref:YhgE/Pip domain-containing protein n=1 Tax=Lacticaseibacillus pabuli TaxID=3025672 RepID=UPI00300F7DFA